LLGCFGSFGGVGAFAGFLTVLAVLAGTGCSGGDDQQGLGPATGSTCPEGSTLTYETFGRAFIVTYCAECHDRKERPILSTLEAVQVQQSAIDRAAAAGPNATNTYMPQDGSVPLDERRKLGEWLACGAP
jgi:hypothetical protein